MNYIVSVKVYCYKTYLTVPYEGLMTATILHEYRDCLHDCGTGTVERVPRDLYKWARGRITPKCIVAQ